MARQIRGILLEGPPCSEKTSLFQAIRHRQAERPDAERNTIFYRNNIPKTSTRYTGPYRPLGRMASACAG